jgi:hypothetical protein
MSVLVTTVYPRQAGKCASSTIADMEDGDGFIGSYSHYTGGFMPARGKKPVTHETEAIEKCLELAVAEAQRRLERAQTRLVLHRQNRLIIDRIETRPVPHAHDKPVDSGA